MRFDTILRDAVVVDGSGAAPVSASVAIQGDRIAAVGTLDGAEAGTEVDCRGLVVAPGFIDIHTHYDAQVLWDPDLTPSSWYGVTTVVMGNCGFSLAPTRAADRDAAIGLLENVEAMSRAALEEGIRWDFDDFPSYLATLREEPLALNVGTFVGHTALRRYVLGEAASERASTTEEIDQLGVLLRGALEAGALGFATSKSPSHVGPGGRPVPSRLAENEEIFRLGEVVGAGDGGVIQTIGGPGYGLAEFRELSLRSGRPITWSALHGGLAGDRHWELLAGTEELREEGLPIWAQVGCLPVTTQFTLERPYMFEAVPAWGELGTASVEDRLAVYADRAWRTRALREMEENREQRTFTFRFHRLVLVESDRMSHLIGRSAEELAADMGGSPLDAVIDVSVEDGLQARWELALYNDVEEDVAQLLLSDATILGLSDAGAHASQLCDAVFAPHLLGHWVRDKGVLSLEQAVWRLTGHPAEFLGLTDRGVLREGAFADICAFDPASVSQGPPDRIWDLPAGADRLVRRATGIEHVLVNGDFIRRDQQAVSHSGPGVLVS